MNNIYQFDVKAINGDTISLADFKGKALLIVNTASKCGFTPQYKGLEKLHKEYKDKGFAVLGFPCNQFGQQEPGSDEEIAQFCDLTFQVSFPMFSKVD
ncbi:MAG: redoxin domain-containing protein, partial [Gammaproteobacteria bacterium]|nr:redoxin domain-containing protein [Gammaproteobacteria bacterium]